MGKSPDKWLKSVLFGKKTSRSGSAKAKDLSVCQYLDWRLKLKFFRGFRGIACNWRAEIC